ncbi:MAG: TonB-dependent receptor [Burkholderiales bacterium]
MKRCIIAAALAAAAGVPAWAAEPGKGSEELAPVVVTATRFPDIQRQFPIGVSVITEADIRNSTASTVPELLRMLPGVQTRDLSGSPNLQVDLRGFGIFGDQNTLVLLDGQRISENEQVTVNWSAIPLDAIERIEVIRGGGAVLYGAGATGGTINIITKTPVASQRSAFVEAGIASHRTRDARAGANIAGENTGLRLTAAHRESDNYRDNNALRIDRAQLDLRHSSGPAVMTLKLGADDQRSELPGSISEAQIAANRRQAALPGDFALLRGGYLNLGAERSAGALQFAANLSYREKDTDASFFVATPFRNNVQTQVRQLLFTPRAKLPYGFGGATHTLVAGMDMEDWDFQGVAGPAIVGRPDAAQRGHAVYAQHTTLFSGGTSLALGIRDQRVTYSVDDAANAAPRAERTRNLHAHEIALRRPLGGVWAAYGKVGRSFRVPNVNDNYSLFTATVALLEPQTARDREIGVEAASGPARYRLALYEIELENEIVLDPVTFTNRNLPPTRRRGVEAEARWHPASGLDLSLGYAYAEAEFRAGNFGGTPIAGNDVPLVPRHALNLAAGWRPGSGVRIDGQLRHVGEQRYDSDELNVFNRRLPAYTVVDLKLGYERAGWRLAAGVQNLFNTHYFSYGVFTGFPTYAALPAPERTVFLTARHTFR